MMDAIIYLVGPGRDRDGDPVVLRSALRQRPWWRRRPSRQTASSPRMMSGLAWPAPSISHDDAVDFIPVALGRCGAYLG